MNSTVDDYLKDSIDMWLDLGVDGIRVDAVKHMPMGWQSNWLSAIYEEHETFVFGEWFSGSTGNDSEMTGFANESGMSLLEFRLANAIRNTLGSGTMSMQDLYSVMVDREQSYKEINDQVTFIDNHDMSRFMTLANGNGRALENAYVIMMTSSGIPTIYYGSEQYATGDNDPYNRGDMPGFSTTSTAYQVIAKLATLRKSNAAVAYGTTQERWMNSDVLVYERTFGNSTVLVAVNRSSTQGYNIGGAFTALPDGQYADVLCNLLGGGTLTIADGAVGTYYLQAGQAAVWQYSSADTSPVIGNIDPLVGIAGNIITITGSGFGASTGTVRFDMNAAQVVSWSDSLIQVQVPVVTAGYYDITVTTSSGAYTSNYDEFKVLTGSQTAVRFIAKNATTEYGQNVYLVGNCVELGNWDTSKAIGPFYNATETIASYPDWFFDVSVPEGYNLEFKFIKKDAAGNVIWESGTNHAYTVPTGATSQVSVYFNN